MPFSIYYLERPMTQTMFGQEVVIGTHAYVALAEEWTDAQSLIAEEIHFKNEGFMRLRHHKYGVNGFERPTFEGVSKYGHIGGKLCDVKPLWDRAVAVAEKIEELNIPFCGFKKPDSYNCRAASEVMLKAMGLELYLPEKLEVTSGMQSDLWERLDV